jgi:hypothetical protein
MLTEKDIMAARPRDKGYKLGDSRGLYVYVTPAGGKSFRLKYRIDGVEKRLTFGLFPEVSLSEARRLRETARMALKAKRDPADHGPALDPGTVERLNNLTAPSRRPDKVYFLRGDGGLIKVGVTKNVAARVAALQRDHPATLTIMGAMPGSYSAEMTIHRLFAEDRDHGEWFRPSQRLLDFIDDYASLRGLPCH